LPLEGIAGLDVGDGSNGQIPREDAVHAAGDHALPDAHFVVVGNIFHGDKRFAHAANRALDARVSQHRPDAAFFVRQQKDLSGMRIRFNHLPDDAIRRDDAHVLPDAVALPAVQFNGQAGGACASTNYPRGEHGHVRMRLPETEKHGKSVGFSSLSLHLGNAQLQRIVLTAQLLVIFSRAAEGEVVSPDVAKPAESVGAGALEGRNGADGPGTDQAALRIALNLHGQKQHLQEDDSCEQDQRLVARGDDDHKESEIRKSKLETRNLSLASGYEKPTAPAFQLH
jgi:hypothetical protein